MKWYQKTWGIVLLLLFFFPAGLYFLWKSERSKNAKIAGTIAVALLVIYSIATKPPTPSPTSTSRQESTLPAEVTQELKDNIIFRLNSQLKEVRNIAIKRTGNLINRDDVRQTLINLILNHDLDSR